MLVVSGMLLALASPICQKKVILLGVDTNKEICMRTGGSLYASLPDISVAIPRPHHAVLHTYTSVNSAF